MAKTTNYDDLDVDGLNAAAAEHYEAIRELREQDASEMTAVQRLKHELAVAEHRAHLAVINPLRTELRVQDELGRSDMVRRMRGMSKDEWQRLHQVVNDPDAIADGAEAHTPGAE